MSSQKTEHYQLHAWEPSDPFLRGEFNANFSALDAALHDGLAAVVALAESRADVVFGSYTGDLTNGRLIDLGFRPKAVILPNRSFAFPWYSDRDGGVFFENTSVTNFSMADNGFLVSHNQEHGMSTNSSGAHYFIAYR